MAAWIFQTLQEKAKPLQHFLLAFIPGMIPARIFHCQQREGWTRKVERTCGGAATKPKFPGLSQVLATPCSSHPSIYFFFFFRNMNYINAFCHVPGGLEGVDVLLSSTSLEKLFEMHRSELSPTTPSQSCFPVAFIFSTNSGDHLIHLSFPRWKIGLDEPIMRPKRSVRAGRWECFASANYFSGLDFSVKFWR